MDKRITELLALLSEYLQMTDRLLVRMDEHDLLFEKQFARMDLAYQVIVTHSEKIEDLQHQAKDLRQQTKEIQVESWDLKKDMLKQETKNEAIFNEILSISKRVQTLEGNP